MSRMTRIIVAALALLALCAATVFAADPKTMMTSDFANSKYKINFKVTDTKDISGKLPTGWSDNSEWNAEITLAYTPTTEDGVTFLRMEKSAGTRAQLAYSISKKMVPGTYHFTMELKSPSNSTPEIGVRLNSEPYNFLWTTSPALTDEWTKLDEEFELDPQGASCGIYICINDNGTLDLRNVKLELLQ